MPPVSPARIISPSEIVPDGEYATVAASQTAQALGASGGVKGDAIFGIWVVPSATTAGVVTLIDGSTSINLYAGGTLGADLKGWYINLGILSTNGAWKITTGVGLSVVAIGKFT